MSDFYSDIAELVAADSASVSALQSKTELLHGKLSVHIVCARGLPVVDGPFRYLPVRAAQSLPHPDCGCNFWLPDAFVEVSCGDGARVFKSDTHWNSRRPAFNERFEVDVCHETAFVDFTLKDQGVVSPSVHTFLHSATDFPWSLPYYFPWRNWRIVCIHVMTLATREHEYC